MTTLLFAVVGVLLLAIVVGAVVPDEGRQEAARPAREEPVPGA